MVILIVMGGMKKRKIVMKMMKNKEVNQGYDDSAGNKFHSDYNGKEK